MREADAIRDWVIGEGLASPGQEAFILGLAQRLGRHMPLDRLSIGVPSLDPNIRGVSFSWQDDRILSDTSSHGAEGEAAFRTSPIFHARAGGRGERAWNLRGSQGLEDIPLLAQLRAEGFRHYLVKLLAYPNEPQLEGVALTLATKNAKGFDAGVLALVDALLPAIGLTVYRIELSRIAREVLGIYVGPRTSGRILSGSIHRGDGEAIEAAILFADFKGFTLLSERLPATSVVRLLNERFDLIDDPVRRHGGEILKFMGDGLLAVFPAALDDPSEACARTLRAACEALAANAAADRTDKAADRPDIALDIALHLGEVFYGNVGASRRLDFTVIGRAVNLAARIEKLCDRLNRNLLLSEDFAASCGTATVPLGRFDLKGLARPQSIFALE